jgi:hypothetical protein
MVLKHRVLFPGTLGRSKVLADRFDAQLSDVRSRHMFDLCTTNKGRAKPMMRRHGAIAVLLFLFGCTESPPPPQSVSTITAIGTPFLIAFKIPACVATVVIAGPAAALQQLAAPNEDGLQPDIRPALDAGLVHNCGPPYEVAPR